MSDIFLSLFLLLIHIDLLTILTHDNFNDLSSENKKDYDNIQRLIYDMVFQHKQTNPLTNKSYWENILKKGNYNYPIEYVHNRCDNICTKFKTTHRKLENTNQLSGANIISECELIYFQEKQFMEYVVGENQDKTYDEQIRKFHSGVLNNKILVSNKFSEKLCSFNETTIVSPQQFVRDVLTSKTNKNYYMNIDLSERAIGSYRRFSIDIDCKKYNSKVFTRDIQYLDYYIHSYEEFNEHNIYWCIDIAPMF